MDAAEPDAHIEVEDDPEAHLSTFTEKQKAWAAKHSLDLLGDAGMMLAANLKWPEQHRLQVATEGGFLRAYTAFGILNKAGLYVGDLSNGKTQAIAVFTDQYQLQLKEAGMLAPELQRIVDGLGLLCNTAGGSRKRKSLACTEDRASQRVRASTVLVDKVMEVFADDLSNESVFGQIKVGYSRPCFSLLQMCVFELQDVLFTPIITSRV